MKKLLFSKTRKKGNAFLEFIIVLPVFLFMGWAIMQIVFFLQTQSTAHEASMEASRLAAMEIRGNTKDSLADLSADKKLVIRTKVYHFVRESVKFNGLFLLLRDDNGALYSDIADPTSIPADAQTALNEIVIIDGDGNSVDQCKSEMTSKKRVICMYLSKTTASGHTQEQVVVNVKGPFKVMGSWMKLDGRFYGHSMGTSEVEKSGRFNYAE